MSGTEVRPGVRLHVFENVDQRRNLRFCQIDLQMTGGTHFTAKY